MGVRVRGASDTAGVLGWSKVLTHLLVAASHSCSKRASSSPAAQPRQPPTSSAGGEGVQRPTYMGKGILQRWGFVLAHEWKRMVLHLCRTLFLNQLGRPSPAGFGVEEGASGRAKGRRNSRSQFQFCLLPPPGFPARFPTGRGMTRGEITLMPFGFSIFTLEGVRFFSPITFFL